jgi:chromosome segregation ATPase
MPMELLTYADLGARLNVSSEAARALVKRLQLPRSLGKDGKAVVRVDLDQIRHTPRPHRAGTGSLQQGIETLQAEIARLEGKAASHRADFERERERADHLMAELLKATAETLAAKEATARLEGEVDALRSVSSGAQGQAAARIRYVVEADRRACK